MSLTRVLVTGDQHFNNYFKAYPYLKELVPKNSLIVHCGGGASDEIANLYAANEGFSHETYLIDWDKHGKGAAHVRNTGVVRMCRFSVIFWDGVDPYTESLIKIAKYKKIKPNIIEYGYDDLIKPHKGRVVHVKRNPYDIYCGRGSIFGNPFPITKGQSREVVVMRYMDYVMRNKDLIEAILSLDSSKRLGCYCAPQLCHCDAISWLMDNARDELKMILSRLNSKNNGSEKQPKKSPDYWTLYSTAAAKFTAPGGVYSIHGMQVSTGWNEIVHEGRRIFVEILDSQMIKQNIHLSQKTIDLLNHSDESNIPTIKYHTNEIKNIPVVYRQVAFADSPYKEGCWYVDVTHVELKQ